MNDEIEQKPTDEQIDADLRLEVPGFDPNDTWGEYGHDLLRAAYRAGFEEALRLLTSPGGDSDD